MTRRASSRHALLCCFQCMLLIEPGAPPPVDTLVYAETSSAPRQEFDRHDREHCRRLPLLVPTSTRTAVPYVQISPMAYCTGIYQGILVTIPRQLRACAGPQAGVSTPPPAKPYFIQQYVLLYQLTYDVHIIRYAS